MPDFASRFRFESPEWLWAFSALPLILLMYLLRREAARWIVPHLPLWEKVFATLKRRRSFVVVLLSILLWLTIASVAILAMAGPYEAARKASRLPTVLVLDRSLGTRARSTADRALADEVVTTARALFLVTLRDGPVSLAYVASGFRALCPPTKSPSELEAALAALPEPHGGRDLEDLVTLRAALDSTARIVFVTPFLPSAKNAAFAVEAKVHVMPVGSPLENAGIVGVTRSSPEELSVEIAGPGSARRLRLLDEDEEELAAWEVIPRDEVFAQTLQLPARLRTRARLVLDPPDAFPEDDSALIEMPDRERLRVLVVTDVPTPFLDAVLEALSEGPRLLDVAGSGRLKVADFGELSPDVDVVILAHVDSERPLPPGNYLLLGSMAPELSIRRERVSEGPLEPVKIRADDPLVRALDLREWRVDKGNPTEAQEGFDVIVDGNQGPLLGRGRTPFGRFIFLAVGPDSSSSTLPELPAFPLLVEAALRELAGRRARTSIPVYGAESRFDLEMQERAELVDDLSNLLVLKPIPDGTGYRLPSLPGRFRVSRDGGAERSIAVAWLGHPGRPASEAPPTTALSGPPELEERRTLRPWLFAILAALLVLEWWSWSFRLTD